MASLDLSWSIKNGDIEQVKEHIDNDKIDVNSSVDGRPLILLAADYGQDEIIRYLISKGADVNATDKHGISALLAAVWEGHTECVKTMLDAGADRNGKTPEGKAYWEVAEKPEIKSLLK